MHKITFTRTYLAGLSLLMLLPVAHAQSDTSKIHIGTIQVSWKIAATQTPDFLDLKGHVKITSDDYDLYADDIKAYSAPRSKTGPSGLQKAVAVGGAVPGTQVIAHIRRPLDSESTEIYSDRAVYTPDRTRPSGGKMTFTGHVKVVTTSGFFAEPSVSTFDNGVTFLLGVGEEYPRFDSGPGHITLTPAQ